MQNSPTEFNSEGCRFCGSMRFAAWEDLDEDARLVAKRLLQTESGNREGDVRQFRYCKRCLHHVPVPHLPA